MFDYNVVPTPHHIVPQSRGGVWDNNITDLYAFFHANWHRLFRNLTVPEAHVFIDVLHGSPVRWNDSTMYKLRKAVMSHEDLTTKIPLPGKKLVFPAEWRNIWEHVFGDLSPEQVHVFIDVVMVPGTRWSWHDLRRTRKSIKRQQAGQEVIAQSRCDARKSA